MYFYGADTIVKEIKYKKRKNEIKMREVYKLYLKVDGNGYMKYGIGSMYYIRELLYDYLVKNNLYGREEVEFKVVKVQ